MKKWIFLLTISSLLPLLAVGIPVENTSLLDQITARINQTPIESSDFLPLLELQQKQLYQNNEWNRFFANAQFYRRHFLSDTQRTSEHFIESLLALEILGLAKHCQWTHAIRLSQETLAIAQRFGLVPRKLIEAKELIALHQTFPKQNRPKIYSDAPQDIFTSRKHWKIERRYLSRLLHPKNLRVHISNECDGGSS